MSDNSKIEWTDATWSPIRARIRPDAAEIAKAKGYTSLLPILKARKPDGELRSPPGKVGPHCERCSPGCENCYSETNNARCLPSNGTGLPFDRRSRDLVEIFVDEKILMQPWLHWKRPRRIFVCSQTDLFAEFVPDHFVGRMAGVMRLANQHTFQILTKRAARMCEVLDRVLMHPRATVSILDNVILGVSVENQPRADERRPHLAALSAIGWTTFVSYEPALGPVDWKGWEFLDWMISGGESGRNARPTHPDWHRNARDWCGTNGVPFLFKQWGSAIPVTCDDSCGPVESTSRMFWLLPDGTCIPPEEFANVANYRDVDYAWGMEPVGKHKAGRLLDGRTWDEVPAGKSFMGE